MLGPQIRLVNSGCQGFPGLISNFKLDWLGLALQHDNAVGDLATMGHALHP